MEPIAVVAFTQRLGGASVQNYEYEKTLSIVSYFVAISLGFWLWTGCISRKTPSSSGTSAEVETQKAGPKKSKAVVSADQVPDAVHQALQSRFPSAKPTEWKAKAGNIYEAEFILKGIGVPAGGGNSAY